MQKRQRTTYLPSLTALEAVKKKNSVNKVQVITYKLILLHLSLYCLKYGLVEMMFKQAPEWARKHRASVEGDYDDRDGNGERSVVGGPVVQVVQVILIFTKSWWLHLN